MMSIGTLPDVVVLLGPVAVLPNIGTDLVVGQEALGLGVRSRPSSALPLLDAGPQSGGLLAAQGVGAPVEGHAHDQLIRGAALRHPQLEAVILRKRGGVSETVFDATHIDVGRKMIE